MRVFFLGAATVGLLVAGIAIGLGLRLGEPDLQAANKSETKPLKMGFVSCSELTLKSNEWQRDTKAMNEKRMALGQKLSVSGAALNQLKMKFEAAVDPTEKAKLNGELLEATRQQEDAQRKGMAIIDDECLKLLSDLHASFEKALKAELKERGLDVVFGCPIHPDQMFKNGQKPLIELNLYFRPAAANPIHLAPELDITEAIAVRMNAASAAQ